MNLHRRLPLHAQSATDAQKRHEVKEIARDVERELTEYRSIRHDKLTKGDVEAVHRSLTVCKGRLAVLWRSGLSTERPKGSLGRSFKNVALLSGAAVSRVAAVPIAGAVGVADLGLRIMAFPLPKALINCEGGLSGAVHKGSMMQRTFDKINQLPAAIAYVEHKKRSTSTISNDTRYALEKLLFKFTQKKYRYITFKKPS